ncbi:Glutamate receptor [Amphibalanus amphitrite]|uniref:Glutamate receptor n=1 Tax=Amphibalanus amphitrite TaxID=1232801 RepID=A0A6A4VE19_AMPAM|nr:Glutamate receptor [Amphibalanus amphitrite]
MFFFRESSVALSSAICGQLSDLLRLLSGRRLFARLRRGGPAPALEAAGAADTTDQVVWLVPDSDSDSTRAAFASVLADSRRRWLLVSLSGRRRSQFLDGYAQRHTYMTVRNGTTRFFKASDFHRHRRVRGVCRGGQYRQRRPRAGLDLSRRAMEGVHLRVLYPNSAFAFEDKVELIRREGVITGGFFGSLFLILQEQLGFSYSLHAVNESAEISAWDQAVQLLHRGEGDMFGGWLMMSNARAALIDFSFPLVSDLAGAAIDSRYTLTLTEFQVTQPLETPVWTALLVTQLLAVLVLCLIARCQQRIRSASGEPSDAAEPSFWALIVLGVSCQQGAAVRSDTANSYRVAITALYWASLFIVACYSGNLLAEMTMARRVMPFDSLQEALEQGWQFTEPGLTDALRERVLQPLMGSDIDRLPMVSAGPREGRNIFMTTGAYIGLDYSCGRDGRHSACPVCLYPGATVHVPMAMSFRPNFQYLQLMNDLLVRMAEHGLAMREFYHWTGWRPEDALCQVGTVDFQHMENKPLTISNLWSVVAIQGLGLMVATAVLVCERLLFLLQ